MSATKIFSQGMRECSPVSGLANDSSVGAGPIAVHMKGVLSQDTAFARAEQRGLRYRVAPIGLHAIPWPRRNQRGRDHYAFVPEQGDLPIEPIATRPCFITKRQVVMLGGKASNHFGHRFRQARNFADKAHLPPSTTFGHPQPRSCS